MPWREETGVRFCKSDSWAPPDSLLRAASRDQTANQRPHKPLPSLRLLSPSCAWFSHWLVFSFCLLPVVACLGPTHQHTLARVSPRTSHSFSSTVDRLSQHSPLSVRIFYRRPFLFNDHSRRPVHLIINLKHPWRVLTRRIITISLLLPHTHLLSVWSTCLERIPGSWIEVLTTLTFCRLRR